MQYLKNDLYQFLKENVDVFDFLQEASIDGIWYWNLERPAEEWINKVLWKTLGYDPLHIDQQSAAWPAIMQPEMQQAFRQELLAHSTGDSAPHERVICYQHREGHSLWFRCKCLTICDNSGTPVRMLVLHTNVTSLIHQADREHKAVEQRLNSLTANFPDGSISLIDTQLICLHTSGKGYERFSINPETYTGKHISTFLTPAVLQEVMTALPAVLAGQTVEKEVPYQGFTFRNLFQPVRDEIGSITSFVLVSQDITARRQAEAALEQARESLLQAKLQAEAASEAKSAFLANMSHEIRTPLNGVIGFLDLLKHTPLTHVQAQYADTAARSAQTLLDTINDILDFSKIEAGKLELLHEETALYPMLSQALETVAFQAHKKGLLLLPDLASDLPECIWADSIRLRQVLINLLANAIKFTGSGAVTLRVTASPTDSEGKARVHFAVQDTGIGIAPENQQKIFEAFAQADSSTTKRYGGTGLGLAISNKLLAKMGGALHLQSNPGQGSTFSFSLHTAASAPPQWPTLPPMWVLLVEPKAPVAALMAAQFRALGMTCETAASGAEALGRLALDPAYDLLLACHPLPGMEVAQLLHGVRNRLQLSPGALPVIVVSEVAAPTLPAGLPGVAQHWVHPMVLPVLAQQLAALQHRTPAAAAPISAMASPVTAPLRMMIAEDNEVNMLLIKTLIKNISPAIEIVEALNGEAAVEQYRRHQPDMVLMDVQMPVLNGYEATQKIRKIEQVSGKHVPVIALTAGTVQGEREKCLAAGMDDYASKPVVRATVLALLHRWVAATPQAADTLAATPAQPHFNRAAFEQSMGDSPLVAQAVLAKVRAYLRAQQQEIQRLAAAAQWEALGAAAHHLKGTALNVYLTRLASLANALETQAIAPNEELQQTLEQMAYEIELLLTIL